MPAVYQGVWQVVWGNPYRKPEGPIVLAEVCVDDWKAAQDKRPPSRFLELLKERPGYVLGWCSRWDYSKRRTWSKEAKARGRVRRLRERMTRKYPLFAEMFIAEALVRRPEYYAAESKEYDC